MPQDNRFAIDGTEHETGDKECLECYAEPDPCDCGGLIHHQYFDESWDSVIVLHKCDLCGDTDSPWL